MGKNPTFASLQTTKGSSENKNNDSVAQLVEQYTFNVWVLGSNPSGITKKATPKELLFLCPLGSDRRVGKGSIRRRLMDSVRESRG